MCDHYASICGSRSDDYTSLCGISLNEPRFYPESVGVNMPHYVERGDMTIRHYAENEVYAKYR